MLDKIKKFLFSDDDKEIVEEFEVEEVHATKKTEETLTSEVSQEVIKRAYEETNTPTPQPKLNLDITIGEPLVKEVKETRRVKPKGRVTTKREEYAIPPVISPFFGSDEEEVKQPVKQVVPVAAASSKPKSKDKYNMVISPMFGQTDVKPMIEDVYEAIEEDTREREQEVQQVIEEELFDVDNLAVDQIVDNQGVSDEDLVQCSLFGEEEKIEEQVDSVVEETEESLPF